MEKSPRRYSRNAGMSHAPLANATFALALLACALVSAYASATVMTAAPKTQTYVGKMFIAHGDEFPAGRVLSSPLENPWYIDYRLGGDACTAGEVYSTGGIIMALNRRMPSGERCASEGLPTRQYTLLIDNPAVCARFGSAVALNGGGCTYTTPAQTPGSIEPNEIFKGKVTGTNVIFYFIDGGITYRVATDGVARVEPVPGADTRIVTYDGSVTISEYKPWPEGYVPFAAFNLPFKLRFDRIALATL